MRSTPLRALAVAAVLGLIANGCGRRDEAPASPDLQAALARIEKNQADLMKKIKGTKSALDSLLARGLMVVPPGRTWAQQAVLHIPLLGSPTKGPADAPVEVIEFGDFECPFCRRNWRLSEELLRAFPGQIRFVFKHFPLVRKHKNALLAARASVAAHEQGRFWPMHDLIYETGKLTRRDLIAHARTIGLDMASFIEVMDSPQAKNAVGRDKKYGKDAGVRGTPTYFVNGKRVDGNQRLDVFTAVRAELEALGLEPAKAGKAASGKEAAPAPGASTAG